MISELAMDELEAMKEAGLDPTPRDIVRLNALGLKLDHSAADDILYQTRRTATIEDVTLQEPTIGHELFLADLRARGFDDHDPTTFVILRSWVLSLDAENLPRTYTVPGVRKVIGEFIERHFCRVTLKRLTMAVNYVLFGFDSASLEMPERKPSEGGERTADDRAVDDAWNFALGAIHAGEVYRLGISLADARRHTVAEMNAIIMKAIEADYAKVPGGLSSFREGLKNQYIGEFYTTVEAIKERLKKEKTDGTEHQV